MNAIITKIEINARDKFEFLFNDQHPANHLDRNTTTTMNKCIMKETNNKRKDGRNGEKEKKKVESFPGKILSASLVEMKMDCRNNLPLTM